MFTASSLSLSLPLHVFLPAPTEILSRHCMGPIKVLKSLHEHFATNYKKPTPIPKEWDVSVGINFTCDNIKSASCLKEVSKYLLNIGVNPQRNL